MKKFGENYLDRGAAAKNRLTNFDEQQEDEELERSSHQRVVFGTYLDDKFTKHVDSG